MKRLLLICALALMLVPAALAATPAVTVSPASPVFGQTYTLAGCGYPPVSSLLISVTTAPSIEAQNITTDLSGCFTTTWTASWVGAYHASVYTIRKNGKSLILQASADYTVPLP